jgi:hypothetical protein
LPDASESQSFDATTLELPSNVRIYAAATEIEQLLLADHQADGDPEAGVECIE